VEREAVLLGALASVAAQQAAAQRSHAAAAAAVEAALQVATRLIGALLNYGNDNTGCSKGAKHGRELLGTQKRGLLATPVTAELDTAFYLCTSCLPVACVAACAAAGSYLYQWPTQRTKTHAALAQLLVAADAATDSTPAAAAAAAAADAAGVANAAASCSNGGGVLLRGVIDSLVRELLAATLKQLTPYEVSTVQSCVWVSTYGQTCTHTTRVVVFADTRGCGVEKLLAAALKHLTPPNASSDLCVACLK
jgi:hypothetical protein